jgi:isopenicillin N synthase-like dioxygenase
MFLFRACFYAPETISAFDSIMDRHKSTLRLNYYPKREDTPKLSEKDNTKLACPEHFDSGLLTILSQDNVGGLQGNSMFCLPESSRYPIVSTCL